MAAAMVGGPALALDRASDAEEFRAYVQVCQANPDERGLEGCIADQVDSKVNYLGDILSETAGGLTPKQQTLLDASQAAFETYREAACGYHVAVATGEDGRAQMFCLLRLTNQRIADVLEGADYLAHE